MPNLPDKLKSKWWRLNNLYKIKKKTGAIQTFRPNQTQLQHIVDRGAHRYNLILKARQLGFTTLYLIDYLDESLWTPGIVSGILAHEAQKLPAIFSTVKRAFDNLPEILKPTLKADTKYSYEFINRYDGEKLDSAIYVATGLRSGTVQNLHITESAFIKDRDELNAASKQAVPITGRISEETTANGFNEFYSFYTAAEKTTEPTEYDYRAYFYSWTKNREYRIPGTIEWENITQTDKIIYGDEKKLKEQYNLDDEQLLWRRWKIKELTSHSTRNKLGLTGLQLFRQEYPIISKEAFQSGAGNVFNIELVEAMQIIKPLRQITPDHLQSFTEPEKKALITALTAIIREGVEVYYPPEKKIRYVIGCDPSDGTAQGDRSAIAVYDIDADIQVAQFYGKRRPDELAQLIKDIAEIYNDAFAGVENNMLSTVLFLSRIYHNIYTVVKEDKVTKKRTRELGIRTTGKTRDMMIDEFIAAFEQGELTVHSADLQDEMKTFITTDTGKREHATGMSDDCLFSNFIAFQMKKHYPTGVRVAYS